jgi:glycosyltransferase involved in cell wall biosynthesis
MFAKYLPESEWKPIILTRWYPHDDVNNRDVFKGITGLPTEQDIVKYELASGHECIDHTTLLDKIKRFLMPEYGQSWNLIEGMVDVFMASKHSASIDAIYATSPDFAQITVGMILGAKLNIPVIVDFRDIPEQDHRQGFEQHLYHLRYLLRRYWATKTAFCALAVSEPQKEILEKRLAIPVHCIPNGYDGEMFYSSDGQKSSVFRIHYVGRIINQWLRNPAVFLEAIDIIINDAEINSKEIEIRFVGADREVLSSILSAYACKDYIKVEPAVAYGDVADLIRSSCINLVLTNEGRSGVMTTKFYEYLAVRRPIICVPDDKGGLSSIIKKLKCGLASSNSAQVADYIKHLYLQWKNENGFLPVVQSVGVEDYSRKNATMKLAQLLNLSVLGKHPD